MSCVPEKPPFLAMLMEVEGSSSAPALVFHIMSGSLTALAMVGSEIFARCSLSSMPLTSNASTTTIINTIPFSTLNISIALAIVVNVTLNMFGVYFGSGVQISLILAALLATNRKARKHLRARLQRSIDSLTVGRIDSLTVGRSCRVEPVTIAVALVPVRDFRGIQ